MLDRFIDFGIPAKESNYFARKYRECAPSQFAVIKVSGACIKNTLEEILQAFGYLQHHKLTPIVILGWGAMLDERLSQQGIATTKMDGDRITTQDVLRRDGLCC